MRIPGGDLARVAHEEIRKLFDDTYELLFGRTYPDSPLEFVTFNVVASLPARPLRLARLEGKRGDASEAVKCTRMAYSPIKHVFIPYTVYDRYRLCAGASFEGPAIIEERESTTVVGEDASVRVDDHGFLFIDLEYA